MMSYNSLLIPAPPAAAPAPRQTPTTPSYFHFPQQQPQQQQQQSHLQHLQPYYLSASGYGQAQKTALLTHNEYDDDFNKMFVKPIMRIIDQEINFNNNNSAKANLMPNMMQQHAIYNNDLNNNSSNNRLIWKYDQQLAMTPPSSSCSSSSACHQDKTKLFVGNLPTSTRLHELLAVFRKYGPINEKLSVVKDHNYAFIHYFNENDAKVALEECNDSLFKDRYIRVQYSTSQGHVKRSKTFDGFATNPELREFIFKEQQQRVSTERRILEQQQQQLSLTRSATISFPHSFNQYENVQQQQHDELEQHRFHRMPSSKTMRPITGRNSYNVNK